MTKTRCDRMAKIGLRISLERDETARTSLVPLTLESLPYINDSPNSPILEAKLKNDLQNIAKHASLLFSSSPCRILVGNAKVMY